MLTHVSMQSVGDGHQLHLFAVSVAGTFLLDISRGSICATRDLDHPIILWDSLVCGSVGANQHYQHSVAFEFQSIPPAHRAKKEV